MSSGSGQLRPAAWKRLIVARTVDAATPIRRAISRVGTPPTNFNRRTSRTWRMVVLSAGIRSLLWTAKGADLSRPAEAPDPPGEIIPEWWATSSRNGGRDHLGIGGRHHPGMRGGFTRNRQSSAPMSTRDTAATIRPGTSTGLISMAERPRFRGTGITEYWPAAS